MQKCNSMFRSTTLILLMGLMPLIGRSQNSDLKSVTNKYAIKNATIVQAPGKIIQKGIIVIDNGIIKAVGSHVAIPEDALVVNADSMFVYAGFISGLSNIGIKKSKNEDRDDDKKLTGNPSYERAGITPGNSAREMLNPKDKSVEIFRKLGFTSSHTVPHTGMIPGTGSIIILGGMNGDDMIVKDQCSMYSQLVGAEGVYPNTVIGVMAKYRDLYKKASQIRDYQGRYNSNPNGMERPNQDATLEALYPVVSNQMTVAFKAEGIKDIMRVITLQKDLGFNMILGEVKQGWDAIPAIKEIGIPVFLSLNLPEWKKDEKKHSEGEDDKEGDDGEKKEKESTPTAEEIEKKALEARQKEMIKNYYTQAGKFSSNGIRFGFSTMGVKSKDFRANLLKVIENGLSEDQALAALTTEPASILDVSNIMGTIEVGKLANLMISDTVYFSKNANVRYVFVDGMKYEYEIKKKSNETEDVDVKGVWNYTTETSQGNGSGIITINGTPSDYTGTISVSYNESTNEIQNIVVDGSNLSFFFELDMGEKITVDVSVDIDGDTLEGNISVSGSDSFPIKGSKEPE